MSEERFNYLKKIIARTGIVYDANRNRIIIKRASGKMLYLPDPKQKAEFIYDGNKVGDKLYPLIKVSLFSDHLLSYDRKMLCKGYRVMWEMTKLGAKIKYIQNA